MTTHTKKLYEEHHSARREAGFSILKDDRGSLFSRLIGKGKDVLDIGCRDGALTRYFLEGNRVVGAEVDALALDRARELGTGFTGIEMDVYGDWSELGERKFDAIVAGEILEHLFNPESIVAKVKSRLKPGGMFLGSVPNAFSLKNRVRYMRGTKRHTPLSDPTHVNHFSEKDLEALLKESFREVEIFGLGRYGRLAKMHPGWFAFDLAFKAS